MASTVTASTATITISENLTLNGVTYGNAISKSFTTQGQVIQRIMSINKEKISVLEFHTLKFYILILLMIGSGILLRNLEFIPKYTIFPIYAGVGFAMFYTSFLYFIYYFKHK